MNVELKNKIKAHILEEPRRITVATGYRSSGARAYPPSSRGTPSGSSARASEAYALTDRYSDVHGNPRSAWGFSSGVTRLSQSIGYADDRMELDRAAGRVLSLASK